MRGDAPVVDVDGRLNPAVVARARGADPGRPPNLLAQADVDVRSGSDGGEGAGFVPATNGTFHAPLTAAKPRPAPERRSCPSPSLGESQPSADPYVIEVTLSNPYTFRQTTIANVTSLLAAVGIVALGIAVIVAAADRPPLHDPAPPADRGVPRAGRGRLHPAHRPGRRPRRARPS